MNGKLERTARTLGQGALVCIVAFGVLPFGSETARAEMDVAGTLIQFNDNGAWSWFEDERAIVDVAAGKMLVSSVANAAGTGGADRHGDVDVAAFDLVSGNVERFTLSDALQADDHDSAALWKRPDGRYVAMYSKHSNDSFSRYRLSTNGGGISSWSSEQTFDNGAGATYSNLHYLPNDNGGAGRLYNFTRSVGFDPNILVSSDHGSTWSYGGRLLSEGDSGDRPYLRYASNGQRIHLISTNQHPRDFDNSIYHAYIENGQLFNSTGSIIDANLFDGTAVAPTSLTPIFTTGTVVGGVPMRRGWTIDIEIDDAGLPYAVFQMRADDNPLDHRFFYARFNGASWAVHPLAKAGGYLYQAEGDYTGLAALDPSDPNRLFISSKIDPRDDAVLAHYEIFQGITSNDGASWQWSPITYNSTVDNIRPIVPKWDDEHTALLWMRGHYSTYVSYNLDIVGLTEIAPIELRPAGDLNRDGTVDLGDIQMYIDGLHSNLGELSFDEAYREGDLNGDLVNNHQDFLLFKDAYDTTNGAGALAAALQVPEPGGLAAIAAGGVGALVFRNLVRARGLDISAELSVSGHVARFNVNSGTSLVLHGEGNVNAAK